MIAQNEVSMNGDLANEIDNCTVSYKHCTGRTQIEQW